MNSNSLTVDGWVFISTSVPHKHPEVSCSRTNEPDTSLHTTE